MSEPELHKDAKCLGNSRQVPVDKIEMPPMPVKTALIRSTLSSLVRL
ncbi:MAG: hypothetical protein HGB26_03690 [Desulfobulbaceae bacterium]|nr:hypothetical protein [Desulfobulbaceae bacterium]